MTTPSGVQRVGDLLVLDAPGRIVVACDSIGGIGPKPADTVSADAATVAIRAGNDIMMTTPKFYEGAIEAVRSGRLKESEIDAPCARLLALKFRMGLFENPRRADLVAIDHDGRAIALRRIFDVGLVQGGRDLAGLAQVQIGIEQRVERLAHPKHDGDQHGGHARGDA